MSVQNIVDRLLPVIENEFGVSVLLLILVKNQVFHRLICKILVILS